MGMSRDEFRKALQDASTTPAQRAKDWAVMKLAQLALIVIVIWSLTHLDDIAAWLNGQ